MKEKVSDRGGCIQGAGALLLLLLLCTKELVVQIPAHHVQHFCKLASTLLLLRVRAPVHSMHCRVQFFYFYPILPSSSSSFSFSCCCNGCNPASPHATRAQLPFLTHKLHSEGKWQNWMRHNLEGNNFSINIFSQESTYHRILMKGIFYKDEACAGILKVTWSDVFKNSEGNRIIVSYYCFDSRSCSCKFLMSVFVILRWLPAWEQSELLSLTTVWIIDAEVGKTCRSQSLYRIQ